ncbi:MULTISPECIES: DUF2125 domain-containing protein [unclassified Rhizobium]|uniref:DUF2125 domain-containing protein n=1 Tax=unclassified Rhizobium TaxID=2613769 RepID=UPI001ADBFCA7|nr:MULTISPECIES: DUF2125 domain-containing protein [unclassified Rhizobium]MBO9100050.1 DUF2125 domain-containing protein [Rhizobium sp. L58/93]MBO9135794.1 DUF2125 domain-containing protein [Rhizobium sp. B209b/85]MBO9169991.1 DUF2125 domain-containing protein [Rhizobium sp. L245/93]MBO9185943.1 DUF2125 domain-containing protein [Rhizobium sp. E27B/91]QXZ82877.1 DUF2125 domain-containing protein [Rhizobium sp. K1/93]
MSASSQSERSGRGFRGMFILLGIIVLLAAVYTAGWFYAASALKTNVLRALGKQDAAGFTGQCTDLDQQGFPFRIGLTCSKVQVDDHTRGVSATFDDLSASAHVYAPGNIEWQLNSPAEIRTSQGLTISSEWAALQSTMVTRGNGIEQGATTINGLKTAVVSSATGQTVNFTADKTEIHVRQNGEDLEAVFEVKNSNAVIKDFPQLPALAAEIDVTLTGKAGLLDGSEKDGRGLFGASGILRKVTTDIGDGRIMTLSGPFSFDDDGFLSGQFKLEIQQISHWRDSIKQAIPAAKQTVDMAGKLLKALAAGEDKVSVDLTVDHGAVTLSGFIPVGKIPPI